MRAPYLHEGLGRREQLAADYAGCVVKDIPRPEPGPGEVRIRVRAAAVNFPDLMQTRGEHQHKPPLPFIPGMEIWPVRWTRSGRRAWRRFRTGRSRSVGDAKVSAASSPSSSRAAGGRPCACKPGGPQLQPGRRLSRSPSSPPSPGRLRYPLRPPAAGRVGAGAWRGRRRGPRRRRPGQGCMGGRVIAASASDQKLEPPSPLSTTPGRHGERDGRAPRAGQGRSPAAGAPT